MQVGKKHRVKETKHHVVADKRVPAGPSTVESHPLGKQKGLPRELPAIDGSSSEQLRKNIATDQTPLGTGGKSAVGSPAFSRFGDVGLLGAKARSLAEGNATPETYQALAALLSAVPGLQRAVVEGKARHLRENDLPKEMIGDPDEARIRAYRSDAQEMPVRASQLFTSRSFLLGVAAVLETGGSPPTGKLRELAMTAGAEIGAAIGPPYDEAAAQKYFVLSKTKEPHLWALEKALSHALIAAETMDVPLAELAKTLSGNADTQQAFSALCKTAMAEARSGKETRRETYFALREKLVLG